MRSIYEIIEDINRLNVELISAIQEQEQVNNTRLISLEDKQLSIKEGLQEIVNRI